MVSCVCDNQMVKQNHGTSTNRNRVFHTFRKMLGRTLLFKRSICINTWRIVTLSERSIKSVVKCTEAEIWRCWTEFPTLYGEVSESWNLVNRMSTNLKTVKEKSVVGFNALCVWISDVINKTTGYDQITEIEKHVNESERKFEYTTKQLRELNAEYLVSSD